MPKINDLQDYIDPDFLESVEVNGGGQIDFSGELVINSDPGPVEIPMIDGSVSVFDESGNLVCIK